jgi:hypothetical protein
VRDLSREGQHVVIAIQSENPASGQYEGGELTGVPRCADLPSLWIEELLDLSQEHRPVYR